MVWALALSPGRVPNRTEPIAEFLSRFQIFCILLLLYEALARDPLLPLRDHGYQFFLLQSTMHMICVANYWLDLH